MGLQDPRLPPQVHIEPRRVCAHCGGSGHVVREAQFRLCVCSAGRVATADGWHNHPIHPEDLFL